VSEQHRSEGGYRDLGDNGPEIFFDQYGPTLTVQCKSLAFIGSTFADAAAQAYLTLTQIDRSRGFVRLHPDVTEIKLVIHDTGEEHGQDSGRQRR